MTRRLGFDYAWGNLTPAAVKQAGGSFVCGYISGDASKDLTRPEIEGFNRAGVDVVLVYETVAGRALGGYDNGVADADRALQRMHDLGAPPWVCVYYAVDIDATPSQQVPINAYFRGVRDTHHHKGAHRVGAYGGYYVIKRLFDAGLIERGWQTYAWSGGQWDARAHLHQWKNAQWVGGVSVDFDYGYGDLFGQWHLGQRPGPAPKPRPAPKPGTYPGVPIREGMHGSTVKHIQVALNAAARARLVVDGIYGPRTQRAVESFQKSHHLTVDGIVGPRTWAALFHHAKESKP
jgi:hypothetical protein